MCGLDNSTTYWLFMNGRKNGGPGGPSSEKLQLTPRPAGDQWAAISLSGHSQSKAAPVESIAMARLTTCPARSQIATEGRFVAVASSGGIFYSTDGRGWEAATSPSGWTTPLYAVAGFANNLNNATDPGMLFVAIGAMGSALSSKDGISWTLARAPSASLPSLKAIAAQSGNFIAVGAKGSVQSSADGVTWTNRVSGISEDLHAIIAANNRLFAAGDASTLLLSNDSGASWTTITLPNASGVQLRALGHGYLRGSTATDIDRFLVGGSHGYLASSTDGGATWTSQKIAGASTIIGIGRTSRYLLVDDLGQIFFSDNGSDWSLQSTNRLEQPSGLLAFDWGYLVNSANGSVYASW